MATRALQFTKTNNEWVANFTSEGNTVVEIEREESGLVAVRANLSGMRAVPISTYNNGYTNDAIIRINVPVGVEITIISQTEVTNAKMMVEG